MNEYEVIMDTPITTFSTKVYADTKNKATYKAYQKWRGKELSSNVTFTDFLKWFFVKTIFLS